MKRFPKYLLISLSTFLCGAIAVSFWFLINQKIIPSASSETLIKLENQIAEVEINAVEDDEITKPPLEKIWQEDEKIEYNGFIITKKCDGTVADNDCKIKISKNNKTFVLFESGRNYWLQYGFFNFLGDADKQLIVHTYSGGAHCCYDYIIYDLQPNFRVLYDSRKFDRLVGSQLIPVDINKDGVFEFEQSVMSFDYFYASHAGSIFPPAVFVYDKKENRYRIGNKDFSGFILEDTKKSSDWFEEQYGKQSETYKSQMVLITFYNLVYSNNEKSAWEYFDKNYNFEDKEDFRKDVKVLFSKDPTYKSIYH